MSTIVITGLTIFLFIGIGFIFYMVKLNHRAKKEQSVIDPDKIRTWSDN